MKIKVKSIKTVLVSTLSVIILFSSSACGADGKQSGNSTVQTTSTMASTTQSSTAAATDTLSSEEASKESLEKGIQSELEMVTEKAKKLNDINGLILVKDLDDTIAIDLKYATKDNFTGKKVYPSAVCALQKGTAIKLSVANMELKKQGLKLKIWDAYRPLYVQQIFWDIVQDSRFVANPQTGGSIHNQGCAVDVTVVDESGKEVAMPTGFDDFSEKAAGDDSSLSADVKYNLQTLRLAMINTGFYTISTEWWHFEDSESSNYTISDVKLEEFVK